MSRFPDEQIPRQADFPAGRFPGRQISRQADFPTSKSPVGRFPDGQISRQADFLMNRWHFYSRQGTTLLLICLAVCISSPFGEEESLVALFQYKIIPGAHHRACALDHDKITLA